MYGTPGLSMERSSSVAAALPYHSALTAPLSTPSASPGPGLQLNTVLRESGSSSTSGARLGEAPSFSPHNLWRPPNLLAHTVLIFTQM
ncbi:hypothetical protein QQF64_013860 [Cirrhinus molitorella]